MSHAEPESTLALLPEVDARRLLAGAALRLSVLRPPYPAAGLGTLRVLRVAEREEYTEVVAGYDGYEPLGRTGGAGR